MDQKMNIKGREITKSTYTYFETKQYLNTGFFQIDWKKINTLDPINIKNYTLAGKKDKYAEVVRPMANHSITNYSVTIENNYLEEMIKNNATASNVIISNNYSDKILSSHDVESIINHGEEMIQNESYPNIIFYVRNKKIREMFRKYLNEHFDPRNFNSSEKAYTQVYTNFLNQYPIAMYLLLTFA